MKEILEKILYPLKNTLGKFKKYPIPVCLLLLTQISAILFYNYAGEILLYVFSAMLCSFILSIAFSCARIKYVSAKNNWGVLSLLSILAPFVFFLIFYIFSLGPLGILRTFAVPFVILIITVLVAGRSNPKFTAEKMIFMTVKAFLFGLLYGFFIFAVIYFFAVLLSLFISIDPVKIPFAIAFTAGGAVFCGYFPENAHKEFDETYNRCVSISVIAEMFAQYAVVPIYTFANIVLLGYAVRAIVTDKWNLLSFLVYTILILLLGVVLYFIVLSCRGKISALYLKAFPVYTVLMLIPYGIAVSKLILPDGLTISRYFIIAVGVFLLIFSVGTFLKPSKAGSCFAYAIILVSICCVLPIINFWHLPAYTQSERAEKILNENNMLEVGILSPKNTISESQYEKLYESIKYLCDHNQKKYAEYLPDNFKIEEFSMYFGTSAQGAEQSGNSEGFNYKTYVLEDSSYSVSEYDILVGTNTDYYDGGFVDSSYFTGKRGDYYFEMKNDALTGALSMSLKLNNEQIISSDMNEFLKCIREQNEDDTAYGVQIKLPLRKLSYEFEGGGVRLFIVFNTVVSNTVVSGTERSDSVNYTMSIYVGE